MGRWVGPEWHENKMIFVENLDEKPALVRLECVKKQLTLTGFPRTIFATAKRRLLARSRRIKSEIHTHSLNGYAVMFQSFLSSHFIQSIDPTPRQRSFGGDVPQIVKTAGGWLR